MPAKKATMLSSRLVRTGILILVAGLSIALTLRIAAFVHLFGKHAGQLLTQGDVAAAHSAGLDGEPLIPRIIHQIYFNWSDPTNTVPPAEWAAARQSCIDHNVEWENVLWTEENARSFLSEDYSWILPMYDGLQFPVQKVDVLRYFLMRHYGGIYIDMDNGCMASLEPLRHYPVFVVDGGRGALSNDILGAAPHHPFWVELTSSLERYNWNYPLPYITISYATGQWFETAMWELYHRQHPRESDRLYRVLTDSRPGSPPHVFFYRTHGGTWDNWDNAWFGWIGAHLGTVIAGLVGLTVLGVIAVAWVWRLAGRRSARNGYVPVQEHEVDDNLR